MFSFYRFDNLVVLALYRHHKVRGGIPVFIAEKGGTIYDFVQEELDKFVEPEGLAKKVFPKQ